MKNNFVKPSLVVILCRSASSFWGFYECFDVPWK